MSRVSGGLAQHSGRALARALGAKVLHGVGLRRVEAPRPLATDGARAFGEFATDDGRRIPLLDGYRDRIKAKWRLDYWPTIALLNVRRRVPLDGEAAALAQSVLTARTLPASLDEFADVVADLAGRYPHELIQSDIPSLLTRRSVVVAHMSDDEVNAIARYYRQHAAGILKNYSYWAGRVPAGTTATLEIGCGMGYAVIAMAGLGVGHAVGIDQGGRDYRSVQEQPAVSAKLGLDRGTIARRTRFVRGDSGRMPFENEQFDLIHSSSVLEHVHDVAGVFTEMARVLRRGGLMIHSVDPYFSPRGGHSSCTLDFPWGHARLTAGEFRRYLQEVRPHEYARAMMMYEGLFNRPRISLSDIERRIGEAGLSVLSWQEGRAMDHLPSSDIVREVERIYPSATSRDLAVDSLELVLIKA